MSAAGFFYNYICHTRASPAEPASPASRAGFAARRAERSVVWPMAAGSPCLLAGQRRRLETCRSRRGCWHVVTRKNRSKSHRFEIERFGPVATYPPACERSLSAEKWPSPHRSVLAVADDGKQARQMRGKKKHVCIHVLARRAARGLRPDVPREVSFGRWPLAARAR